MLEVQEAKRTEVDESDVIAYGSYIYSALGFKCQVGIVGESAFQYHILALKDMTLKHGNRLKAGDKLFVLKSHVESVVRRSQPANSKPMTDSTQVTETSK